MLLLSAEALPDHLRPSRGQDRAPARHPLLEDMDRHLKYGLMRVGFLWREGGVTVIDGEEHLQIPPWIRKERSPGRSTRSLEQIALMAFGQPDRWVVYRYPAASSSWACKAAVAR